MRNKSLGIAVTVASLSLTACGRWNPIPIFNVYRKSQIIHKEAVLRQDLKTLRNQIDNYTADKEKPPQSLQDLVDAGYLRKIPKDPFTDSAETWQVEKSETLISLDQSEPGISDVHSGSSLFGSDGTRYSTW